MTEEQNKLPLFNCTTVSWGIGFAGIVLAGISDPGVGIFFGVIGMFFALLGLWQFFRTKREKNYPVSSVCALLLSLALIILGILYVRSVRHLSARVMCLANLHSLGKLLLYYDGRDDRICPPDEWCAFLVRYARVSKKQFRCPGSKAEYNESSYAMNRAFDKIRFAEAPPDMVMLFETKPGWNQHGGPELLTLENHDGKGCNILLADGCVEWIKVEDINNLRWEVEEPND